MEAMKLLLSATLVLATSLTSAANAAMIDIAFQGPGVSGKLQLTYGPATDSKYPQAFQVTGISGVFTDTNNGLNIVNATVGPLELIKNDLPEPTNLLAPNNFSRFAVAAGLGPENQGFLTYDNLYWPGGSPQTASDYPLHGGVLDIYGLMFGIGNGRVVNFWSNGTISGSGDGPIYGIAVATHGTALDYVGEVFLTPEPGTVALFGCGVIALFAMRRRAQKSVH